MNIPISVIFLAFLCLFLILEMNRRKNVALLRKNKLLLNKLKALKKELDELGKLKSDMLSRIGISLRKPLESVRETAIELSRPPERSPGVKEHLARLTNEITEIENFLDVMKELAFLEKMDLSGSSQFPDEAESSSVSLDNLLFDTLNEWNDEFSSRGVSLAMSIDENVMINGSRHYLKHALENILSEISRIMVSGSLVHIVLFNDEGSVRMKIAYKGEPAKTVKQSAFGVELARQIISIHDGWLTGDSKTGQYVMELPSLNQKMETQTK